MDNLRNTVSETKMTRPSLMSRIREGLPARGTSFKQQIRMLILSDNSPDQIALGTAIGIFIACSPFLGTHTVTALGLALLFHASRPAALLGTFANNPISMAFIYFAEIKLGSWILGYSLAMPKGLWSDFVELFSLGRQVILSLMVGFVIVGIVSAVGTYFFVRAAVLFVRKGKTTEHKS